jgi:hypothetical protein
VTVKTVDTLDGTLLEDAWNLYLGAFEELNRLAVQRHLMYADEFVAVMNDRRVHKYLALDDAGRLVGLSTFTNRLDAVPLISPAYFEHRWPDRYRHDRIWYIGFVAVHRSRWGQTVFAALIEAMWQTIDGTGSVAVFDMCRHNTDVRLLPDKVTRLLRRLDPEVRDERADEQTYWLYEFPH